MLPPPDYRALTRRAFLRHSSSCLGGVALASLLHADRPAAAAAGPHFRPRARRVIYLFMSGGPSHVDLFDYKPKLAELQGQELPASVRDGQRLAQARGQDKLPLVGAPYPFSRHGRAGTFVSDLLPHTARLIDDLTLVLSMQTEPINHDPAVTFLLTGSPQPGRPTVGAWVSYGLGSANKNLPEYVALLSGGGGVPLTARWWGNGFLPANHQGTPFRSAGDPVLYLSNPPGIDGARRRELLDAVQRLNRLRLGALADPEAAARVDAYELAYRMQTSIPELTDISREPAGVREMYGAEPGKPSFAANCLLARRLAERGVRFIQLYHRDWDHHSDLPGGLKAQCEQTDRPAAALVRDLKQRGLLEDTLVLWGGEFGRTAFCQGPLTPGKFGRDHHTRCFAMWLAGGGTRAGVTVGRTDDFGYNVVEGGVHVHDLQATLLHLLGIDHTKLTYRFQGREFRLTDVAGQVVEALLA
jgi:hypothetical protein